MQGFSDNVLSLGAELSRTVSRLNASVMSALETVVMQNAGKKRSPLAATTLSNGGRGEAINAKDEEWVPRYARRWTYICNMRTEWPNRIRGHSPNPEDRELSKRQWENACQEWRLYLKNVSIKAL